MASALSKGVWAAYRGDGVRKTAVSHTVGLVKEILLIISSKTRIFTSVPPKY